uniref:Uncharacterized protein n=1 Tax=Magallana gigas TaxID=29159 RepID=A0A8W8MPD4_MAGGI
MTYVLLTEPVQWTTIPVLVKICKLLLNELFNQIEANMWYDEDEEENPDFSKDPTYQIDLQAYLTEFLQSLSQQACYSTFSSHHNDSEKHFLRTIYINV